MDSQNKKYHKVSSYNKATIKATNYSWEQRLNSLKPFLERTDTIGYIAARNSRAITNAIQPYVDIKNALIQKYGSPMENGQPGQYSITPSSENFADFVRELDETGSIEVEVDTFRLRYFKVVGELSGQQILDFDWMLTD